MGKDISSPKGAYKIRLFVIVMTTTRDDVEPIIFNVVNKPILFVDAAAVFAMKIAF